MAHRQFFFGFLLLCSACGGREIGPLPGSSASGGGSVVANGTGGSRGTAGSPAVGGTNIANRDAETTVPDGIPASPAIDAPAPHVARSWNIVADLARRGA